jgi:hypothetical protein
MAIFAGCGCLLLMLLCVFIVGYAFDSMNLYCTAPFNALFPCP